MRIKAGYEIHECKSVLRDDRVPQHINIYYDKFIHVVNFKSVELADKALEQLLVYWYLDITDECYC